MSRVKFVATLSVAILGSLMIASQLMATVVRVTTDVEGNKLRVAEIEVTSGAGSGLPNRVFPWASIIPSEVIDFMSVPEANTANTITVLGTSDVVAPEGNGRVGLLGDAYLSTGIFNPANASPGIQVRFERPLVNGPGDEVVLFELTIGVGQTPDPMVVRRIDGGGVSRAVASNHYQLQGAFDATTTPNTFLSTVENGGSTDLSELLTVPLVNNGTPTNAKWNATPLDLSWLGIGEWQAIDSLEILSADTTRGVDLLMVVGLLPAYYPGDFDGDYDADGSDFLEWQRQVGVVGGSSADANGDNAVDGTDLNVWREHFGYGRSSGVQAVPEPRFDSFCLAIVLGAMLTNRRLAQPSSLRRSCR